MQQSFYDSSKNNHQNPERRHPKNALNLVEQGRNIYQILAVKSQVKSDFILGFLQ
jgi:hypothetical protein